MKTYPNLNRLERIKQVSEKRWDDVILVLEDLEDEENISSIIRTAEAFGLSKVLVIYKHSLRYKQGKKPRILPNVTTGADKWLDIQFYQSISRSLKYLKDSGFKIYGSLVNPAADILWNQKFRGRVALVLGNESRGLSEKAQKMVDKNLYLPMHGLTESLNVGAAAAIFLYEIIRQKERDG